MKEYGGRIMHLLWIGHWTKLTSLIYDKSLLIHDCSLAIFVSGTVEKYIHWSTTKVYSYTRLQFSYFCQGHWRKTLIYDKNLLVQGSCLVISVVGTGEKLKPIIYEGNLRQSCSYFCTLSFCRVKLLNSCWINIGRWGENKIGVAIVANL